MRKLHNKIRMHRADQRMSQQELADKVGVRRETIGSLENEKYNPSLQLALLIAEALHVPIQELFQLSKETPS
jgi:putative transcriptional regulator